MQISGNHSLPVYRQPLQMNPATVRRALPSQSPRAFGEDNVSISAEAKQQEQVGRQNTPESSDTTESSTQTTVSAPQELSLSEQRVVNELRQRDREVRAHEQAHIAAAGSLASGGVSYTYQVGPDGKRYAVGGEVPIDVSAVPNNPPATLQKAATIRRAALAPANPSGADRAVAMQASLMAAEAQQDLMQQVSAAETTEALAANHTHAAGEACEACRTSLQGDGARSGQDQPGVASQIPSGLLQQALQSYTRHPSTVALNLTV